LDMERRWLTLVRSYEFLERVLLAERQQINFAGAV
jgi:hypothetical protein